MPTKFELKNLAKSRLKEARILYQKGFYDSSVYLSGYVIELGLKARICRILKLNEYPSSGKIGAVYKTHKISDLIILGGLLPQLDEKLIVDPDFQVNWSIVSPWDVSLRYSSIGTNSELVAKETLSALEDPEHGVFSWIKKRW